MPKRQDYVTLEIASDQLRDIVTNLREKLLAEFWSHVPEGERRQQIRARLENSIHSALSHSTEEFEAT